MFDNCEVYLNVVIVKKFGLICHTVAYFYYHSHHRKTVRVGFHLRVCNVPDVSSTTVKCWYLEACSSVVSIQIEGACPSFNVGSWEKHIAVYLCLHVCNSTAHLHISIFYGGTWPELDTCECTQLPWEHQALTWHFEQFQRLWLQRQILMGEMDTCCRVLTLWLAAHVSLQLSGGPPGQSTTTGTNISSRDASSGLQTLRLLLLLMLLMVNPTIYHFAFLATQFMLVCLFVHLAVSVDSVIAWYNFHRFSVSQVIHCWFDLHSDSDISQFVEVHLISHISADVAICHLSSLGDFLNRFDLWFNLDSWLIHFQSRSSVRHRLGSGCQDVLMDNPPCY